MSTAFFIVLTVEGGLCRERERWGRAEAWAELLSVRLSACHGLTPLPRAPHNHWGCDAACSAAAAALAGTVQLRRHPTQPLKW